MVERVNAPSADDISSNLSAKPTPLDTMSAAESDLVERVNSVDGSEEGDIQRLASSSEGEMHRSGVPQIDDALSNKEATKENNAKKNNKLFKRLTIDTDHGDDESDDSVVYGRTLYQEERVKQLADYLDESKENIVHFKAMAKYFGVSGSLVQLPKAA